MDEYTLKSYGISEQNFFQDPQKQEIKNMNLDFESEEHNVKFLGLCPFNFAVSYYIGIDWLKEGESYIMVRPKIPNLDYVRMFVHCLDHPSIYKYVNDIYFVDFSRSAVALDTDEWELTPILIIHFLFLLERIVKQGLKRNYINRKENLNGKIKGKILFPEHLKKNVFAKREDRVFCSYQDYSVDCLENRLLKRALIFINNFPSLYEKYPELIAKKNRLLSAFDHVSEKITVNEISRIKINSIYRDYSETVRVAKLIIQYFGYSYSNVNSNKKNVLPPFWIDMSKLFELYVYSKLKEGYPDVRIDYQSHGKYGFVDFLDRKNKIIIDTKYKLRYVKRQYNGDDIRQLSGYARDRGILKKLDYINDEEQNNTVVDCVIVVPDQDQGASTNFIGRTLISEEHIIRQFTKFYWCGIRLPVKDTQ